MIDVNITVFKYPLDLITFRIKYGLLNELHKADTCSFISDAS